MAKYAMLFIGAMLVAAEVVLLVVPHHSEEVAAKVASNIPQAGKDSTGIKADSIPPARNTIATVPKDTSKNAPPRPTGVRDSVAILRTQLEVERQKVAALGERIVPDTTRQDTTGIKERKTMAKLIDAMDALGAAKILRNMDDKEVKEILLSVKKRQAGKILGSLDPERAARIMK